MTKLKKGDKTPTGWEIVQIKYVTTYEAQLRKRIVIDTKNHILSGKTAYLIYDTTSKKSWIQTDDGENYLSKSHKYSFIE
jgi:hypothetical protein